MWPASVCIRLCGEMNVQLLLLLFINMHTHY